MLSIILKYVSLTFVKKYLKMKKIIFLLILPSLIFAQENQTSVDINNKTETKRKKFIGGYLLLCIMQIQNIKQNNLYH